MSGHKIVFHNYKPIDLSLADSDSESESHEGHNESGLLKRKDNETSVETLEQNADILLKDAIIKKRRLFDSNINEEDGEEKTYENKSGDNVNDNKPIQSRNANDEDEEEEFDLSLRFQTKRTVREQKEQGQPEDIHDLESEKSNEEHSGPSFVLVHHNNDLKQAIQDDLDALDLQTDQTIRELVQSR